MGVHEPLADRKHYKNEVGGLGPFIYGQGSWLDRIRLSAPFKSVSVPSRQLCRKPQYGVCGVVLSLALSLERSQRRNLARHSRMTCTARSGVETSAVILAGGYAGRPANR